MSEQNDWKPQLVDRLIELSNPDSPNRAVMAHLRRGLGLPLDHTLGRVGWLFARVPDPALEQAVLVAGLFALTKGDCPHSRPAAPPEGGRPRTGPSFGTAFGDGLSPDDRQQREKRFVDLLDTGEAELPHKLRQAVTLIARDGVRLDWQLLIDDLIRWDDDDRRVQKRWARGFWAAGQTDHDEAPAAGRPTTETQAASH